MYFDMILKLTVVYAGYRMISRGLDDFMVNFLFRYSAFFFVSSRFVLKNNSSGVVSRYSSILHILLCFRLSCMSVCLTIQNIYVYDNLRVCLINHQLIKGNDKQIDKAGWSVRPSVGWIPGFICSFLN